MSGAFDDDFGAAKPFEPPPSTAVVSLRNPLAEVYLLTELIANNGWIDGVADRCRSADFGVAIHARVFARMITEAAAGRRIEAVTLAAFFADDEEWTSEKMLSQLAAADLNATRDRGRTRSYADHIAMLAKRRRFVAGMEAAIRSARNLSIPLDDLGRDAEETVAAIADEATEGDQAPAYEFADKAIDSFGKPIHGVRSGIINTLDEITGILRPGDQCIVAGGTGMGKTATASSYAIGAASLGSGVLLVSQEMSGDQLVRRQLADMTHLMGHPVQAKLIRDGFMPTDDLRKVVAARDRLEGLPIDYLDIGGLTLAKLRRAIRRQRRRFEARDQTLDLVIIDYLQLMQASRPGMSPYEAASEISKALKQLAREEGVVLMTLAQLSRAYEKRATKRPEKSDLRDSGQIEQDADYIVLLHREEVTLLTEEPVGKPAESPEYIDWQTKMDQVRGVLEFIVPKARHGEPGKAIGFFYGRYQAVRGSTIRGSRDG